MKLLKALCLVTLSLILLSCNTDSSLERFTLIPTELNTTRQGNQLNAELIKHSFSVQMQYIPAGEFEMGSSREEPIHLVYLDAFWIDETEVTNQQFSAFVEETDYQTLAEKEGESLVYNDDVSGKTQDASWQFPYGNALIAEGFDNFPVVQVDWDAASAFCHWRGGRLPTEAEWEKAARGTTQNLYPWGDQFDGNLLNSCDMSCPRALENINYNDGFPVLAPVGSFMKDISPYNVLDMTGNVSEWTSDNYISNYYLFSPTNNPTGPTTQEIRRIFTDDGQLEKALLLTPVRVVRGGGWLTLDHDRLSLDFRNGWDIENRSDIIGFRCAKDYDNS